MTKVSVICPLYNAEKFIAETIQSVLNQTMPDFEFVIVNDGSTDKSKSIVESFADPRIKLINQQNSGIAAARNTGIFNSESAYIAFIDNDDLWLPTKLQKQVAFLDAKPDYCLVGCWQRVIAEDGTYLYTEKKPESHEENARLLESRNVFLPAGTMITRKATMAINGFYSERFLCTFDDYIFFYQAIKYGKCHQLQEVLINYRIVSTSASRMCHKRYGHAYCMKIVKRGYALPEEIAELNKPLKKVSPQKRLSNYHLYIARSFIFHNFQRCQSLRHALKSIALNFAEKESWMYLAMGLFLPEIAIRAIYARFSLYAGLTFREDI